MDVKDDNRELQERLVMYRMLEEKLSGLMNQQNAVANKILELQRSIETIDEMSTSSGPAKDLLFPIGSSAYMKGSISDSNAVIVEVGSDVALEMGASEGKEMLESQMKELQSALPNLQTEIETVSRNMQGIEAEAQDLYQRSGTRKPA